MPEGIIVSRANNQKGFKWLSTKGFVIIGPKINSILMKEKQS